MCAADGATILYLFVREVSPDAFYEFCKIIDLAPGMFSMNANQINRTTSYKLLRNAAIYGYCTESMNKLISIFPNRRAVHYTVLKTGIAVEI